MNISEIVRIDVFVDPFKWILELFSDSQPITVPFLMPSSAIMDVALLLKEHLAGSEVAPVCDLTPPFFIQTKS